MDKEKLDNFFRGRLSDSEQQQVKDWIASQGEGWVDAYMQEHWDNVEFPAAPGQKENMKEKVLLHLPDRERSIKWINLLKVAAVFLLAAAGYWWWKLVQRPPAPEWHIVSNEGTGHQMLKDTLPDGSVVILNEHSQIRYASTYNKKNRTVELTGEAFFEVTHDKARPFIVKAGQVETRVYGTAFSITAYPASGQLRVGLQRGSIGVSYDTSHTAPEKMLVPGQLLIYNKSNNTASIENQTPDKVEAWTTGKLVFYKTPVNDVFLQLEQRYDVHFRYDNSLGDKTITATFDGAPLEKVLQHISFVWNIHFRQHGDSIDVR